MRTELLKGVGVVALGLTLAAGLESENNNCHGEWRLSGKENPVFICKTEENRVLVQGKHTPEHILPEFVTSIHGVWNSWNGTEAKVSFWKYDDRYYYTYEMDLEDGNVRQTGVWYCPYF